MKKKFAIETFAPALPFPKLLFSLANNPYFSFLDSGSGAYKDELGRYSFLAFDPFLTLRSKGKSIEIIKNGNAEHIQGNPFDILRKLLNTFHIGSTPLELPPFIGGAIGYLSYDLCHFMEKVPATARDDIDAPELFFAFYDTVLILDHTLHKSFIAAIRVPGEKAKPGKKLQKFKQTLLENLNSPAVPTRIDKKALSAQDVAIQSNFSKQDYLAAVQKATQYITAGDIYQVNLSQRFEVDLNIPSFNLYQRLRQINPAPFAAYLNFGELVVASSSPERFLKVTNGNVQTRPIKGTRPRGANKIEDEKLAKELLDSEKDRAELIMIVDLERNDLGKICQYGTVKVSDLVKLEVYPTVFHTASTIEGKLYPGKDRVDLLKATFPGGSITGTPKVRAMEIIDELEPTKRSIYTGALGYFGLNGTMDLNIVIRTFLIKKNKIYFQAGGAIVADSDPEKEYQETLDKARALVQSLHEESHGL